MIQSRRDDFIEPDTYDALRRELRALRFPRRDDRGHVRECHVRGQEVVRGIAKVEVPRACRRVNAEALPEARNLLAELDLIPLTSDVIDEAADVGEVSLRSLGAIHLASALWLRADLSAFIAYDHRLGDAASAAGLDLVAPGHDDPGRPARG